MRTRMRMRIVYVYANINSCTGTVLMYSSVSLSSKNDVYGTVRESRPLHCIIFKENVNGAF